MNLDYIPRRCFEVCNLTALGEGIHTVLNLHLFHTNDVHSQLENYMRLGALLRTYRNQVVQRGECALTFDIGDLVDRERPETEATDGRINAALLATLGYDGWVYGNNEGLTLPKQGWPDLVATAKTRVFVSNLRNKDGGRLPGFCDWHIYKCAQLKVGVFGLTPKYDEPYANLGVKLLPPFSVAEEVVQTLQQQGCQIIVALSHLGLAVDRKLAQAVPGIDVILGGHTHQFMESAEWVGHTAVFQPGKHALAFGHTVVYYDLHQGRVSGVVGEPIRVPLGGPMDVGMLTAYQKALPEANVVMHRPLVHLNSPQPVIYDGESRFANLMVDSLLFAYPADIGLMMSGALTASLLAGDVVREHLHAACTTPTRPLRMDLAGSDLWSVVEQGAQPEAYFRPGFGFGFRGSVVGWLALAGAVAHFVSVSGGQDSADAVQHWRLQQLWIQGQPVELNRMYRVVTCEYLWLAPIFLAFRNGQNIEVEPPLVREVLADGLQNQAIRTSAAVSRYEFTREDSL
ncbi:bifunctional metallophosphatase/5'-nucleotidase [Alicyclobacillaceae bacterium I2511]|nr:bifunctional metallophosphatase/5'-nucleotidase [Alicyclobacillaceae bacterium I2511]